MLVKLSPGETQYTRCNVKFDLNHFADEIKQPQKHRVTNIVFKTVKCLEVSIRFLSQTYYFYIRDV